MSAEEVTAALETVLSVIAKHPPIDLDNDPRLVDGRLVVPEPVFEKIKRQAVADISTIARGPIIGIPVVAIPDDGQAHPIGNGKVGIVSPIDRATVYVMDADRWAEFSKPGVHTSEGGTILGGLL